MSDDRLDINDIEHIIRYGQITEITQPRRLWRYRIEGTVVDRTRAACVVELELDDNAILVTVFRLKR
jgi:hypothetical protein